MTNADKTRARPVRRFRHSSFGIHHSAFTLTEILIVIGLIVLMLALAVPAFNLISGGKSIEGAANQLSAALGRARSQAIGLQKVTGVMFYLDNKTGRQTMAIVQEVDTPVVTAPQQPDVWLDLLDADSIQMPVGVGVQLVCDSQYQLPLANPPVRTSDGYMGYNIIYHTAAGVIGAIPTPANNAFGGVILFDGNGRLVSLAYGFRGATGLGQWSSLGRLIFPELSKGPTPPFDFIPSQPVAAQPNNASLPHSQFGLVMYQREAYLNNSGASSLATAEQDSRINTQAAGVISAQEKTEETWLDNNATPFMVNRYNGTLIKGE